MPPGHTNHTWLTPLELIPGAPPVQDVIESPNGSRWYLLKDLAAGDEVVVTLTRCPVDLTLLGFADIRATAARLLAQLGTTGLLDAEDMDSEDMDSEDMDSEDMDSEDMDSEDMDSEDMDSEDMDSDAMDADDIASDAIPSVDVATFGDVYASAQRHALRVASVTPGPADEQVRMTARAGGGDLYFRVRGHLGAFDPNQAFAVAATVRRDNACVRAELTPRWSPLPADVRRGRRRTLVLTNTDRLGLRGQARLQFLQLLTALAHRVDGAVYDLRRDARLRRVYEAWALAPRCVPQANTVVESIRGVVADFAARGHLKYVVIVGGDDVIPFARIEDRAEISREWQWRGPYAASTPLGAALTYGYYLSDDPYARSGALDLRGQNVRAPTFAVGRLVETPADIRAYVQWFLAQGAGGIRMRDGLPAGYTFVRDLAHEVAVTLDGTGTTVDAALVGGSWSAANLASRIPGKDVISAHGHYSANTFVPADGGAKLRPEMLPAAALSGLLWTTIGCHSGHNILDSEVRAGYRRKLSWPEAFVGRGATLVGGTGYQYAESVLLENSELLYVYLTEELTAAAHVAIGDALNAAKRDYLAQRYTLRGMDQKIVEVAALYGLPMLRVRVADPRPRAPLPHPRTAAIRQRGRGVSEHRLTLRYRLSAHTAGGHRFFRADANDGGSGVIARGMRPVLPGVFRDISRPGSYPMGVVWTGGSYTETARRFPALIARPLTEAEPRMPRYRNRAFLPAHPFRIARHDRGASLVFAAMQFDARSGIARRWKDASCTVYYSTRTDATALHDAPGIESPRVVADGEVLSVSIDVRHHGAANERVDAFVSYIGRGELHTVPLTGGPSWGDGIAWVRRFSGAVPRSAGGVFFQAAGGNGRVSWHTNAGALFGIETPAPIHATTLTLRARRTAGYRDRIEVQATVRRRDTGAPVDGEVLFRLRGSRIWSRATGGVAKATLTVAAPPARSPYLVVASFPGSRSARPASASREIEVGKARVKIATSRGARLAAAGRVPVCRLLHLGRDVGLGERPVRITRGRRSYTVYTDGLGYLNVDAQDLELEQPGVYPIRVVFEGDARYLGAAADARVTFVG